VGATVAHGEIRLRDGEHTGARPGRRLRGPLARLRGTAARSGRQGQRHALAKHGSPGLSLEVALARSRD